MRNALLPCPPRRCYCCWGPCWVLVPKKHACRLSGNSCGNVCLRFLLPDLGPIENISGGSSFLDDQGAAMPCLCWLIRWHTSPNSWDDRNRTPGTVVLVAEHDMQGSGVHCCMSCFSLPGGVHDTLGGRQGLMSTTQSCFPAVSI